jgi:hypothetical protein
LVERSEIQTAMASVAKERDRCQNRPHDCGLLRGNTHDRPRSIGHLLHKHTWEGVLSHCTLPRDKSESFKSAGGYVTAWILPH